MSENKNLAMKSEYYNKLKSMIDKDIIISDRKAVEEICNKKNKFKNLLNSIKNKEHELNQLNEADWYDLLILSCVNNDVILTDLISYIIANNYIHSLNFDKILKIFSSKN